MNEPLITPRSLIAYFWNVVAAMMFGYIIVKFGTEKEILTLVIGIIGGTIIGGIFGVYFGANHKANNLDSKTVTEVTPESTIVTTGGSDTSKGSSIDTSNSSKKEEKL